MSRESVTDVMRKAADFLPAQLADDMGDAANHVKDLVEAISELSVFLNKIDWNDLSIDTANETSRMWYRIDAALDACKGQEQMDGR